MNWFQKIISNPGTDKRLNIRFLFMAWFAMQVGAYFLFGVSTPVDSELYIGNAHLILAGGWPQGYELLYASYSLLLASLIFFGFGPTSIVHLQIGVAGAALFCVYQITRITSGNSQAAFMATLLYVLWFEFQQWNLIVYTDALFANMAIVCLYFVLIAKRWYHFLLAAVLIAFTTLLRPAGIGFIIAVTGYLLYSQLKKREVSRVFLTIAWLMFAVVALILINEVLRGSIDLLLHSYVHAEIIYPKITLGLEEQKQLYIPDSNQQPLIQLAIFTLANPLYMLKISALKCLLFLGHIKPYYSMLHNVFIACFLLPVYFFAIKGIKQFPANGIRIFIFIFITFQVITVSLTSENWDGRFLLPVLPWIFILSSLGLRQSINPHPPGSVPAPKI